MFQPDALVIFRVEENCIWSKCRQSCISFTLALKKTRASGRNISESCFPLSWSTENPLVPSFWSQLRNTVFIRKYSLVICQSSLLILHGTLNERVMSQYTYKSLPANTLYIAACVLPILFILLPRCFYFNYQHQTVDNVQRPQVIQTAMMFIYPFLLLTVTCIDVKKIISISFVSSLLQSNYGSQTNSAPCLSCCSAALVIWVLFISAGGLLFPVLLLSVPHTALLCLVLHSCLCSMPLKGQSPPMQQCQSHCGPRDQHHC